MNLIFSTQAPASRALSVSAKKDIGVKRVLEFTRRVAPAPSNKEEGAPSIFMNAADDFNAAWSESAKAAGHYADPTGIDSIATDKAQSSNAQTYNLAGQAVGAGYKGIVVKGNKKFIQR